MINWRLKRLIIEKFGSQADFSMKIERSQSYVSEIIRGRRSLNEKEKTQWAQTLNVDPALIDLTGKPVPERANK